VYVIGLTNALLCVCCCCQHASGLFGSFPPLPFRGDFPFVLVTLLVPWSMHGTFWLCRSFPPPTVGLFFPRWLLRTFAVFFPFAPSAPPQFYCRSAETHLFCTLFNFAARSRMHDVISLFFFPFLVGWFPFDPPEHVRIWISSLLN